MHYNALKELYGVENVYTIDLRPLKAYRRDKYIAYGKFRGVENEKIINMENYRKYKTFNDFMEDIQ